MTSRERLLYSFKKQQVDRTPVSPFIYSNFVKYFFKEPNVDIIQGTIDVYKYFGFDLMHRNINVRLDELSIESPEWEVRSYENKNGGSSAVTTIITTPERELTQVVRFEDLSKYQRVKATVEWFIKDEEDFSQFTKYQPTVPVLEFEELKRAKKLIGDGGITAPWISGVFNYVSDYRKLDDLLVDAIINPDFYKAMMGYFLKRIISHVAQVLDEGVDVLSYAGNIASGTFAGPAFFKEHILEYEKQLIDFIQGRGTFVLYHNCGDAKNMIEVYNELGIYGYESITEPPYGDNDLYDAVSRFDKRVTLIGNMDQIEFLKQANPEDVRTKVREKLEIAADRKGFILGTSDFIEEDTPFENLFALAKGE